MFVRKFRFQSASVFAICCSAFINITIAQAESPFVIVLGVAQDAGFPQAGCRRDCCAKAWLDATLRRHPTCIAIVDPDSKQRWMLECTPHFPEQLRKLDEAFPVDSSPGLDGILLTHAHIGHYAGLIHLGREVFGAKNVKVHAMPRMRQFLSDNGPWSQLVKLNNIKLLPLEDGEIVQLNQRIKIQPMTVPHRDEFSETVAFKISGPNRSLLFLPDIDKWSRWETEIEAIIEGVDVAYLDGSFYDGDELPGRNMAEIPHPFLVETIKRFAPLSAEHRSKVRFIHFNHTNPALDSRSKAARQIRESGMNLAEQLEKLDL